MLEGNFSFGSTSATALVLVRAVSTGSTAEVVLMDIIIKALTQGGVVKLGRCFNAMFSPVVTVAGCLLWLCTTNTAVIKRKEMMRRE